MRLEGEKLLKYAIPLAVTTTKPALGAFTLMEPVLTHTQLPAASVLVGSPALKARISPAKDGTAENTVKARASAVIVAFSFRIRSPLHKTIMNL
jgi:hypothetical protein